METTFENAKVGDRVWDFNLGWGKVIKVLKGDSFPIEVRFYIGEGRSDYESYTINGSELDNVRRTLFWDEIKFGIPTRPKRLVKKTVEYWGNIYKKSGCLHDTKEEADREACTDRIACIRLTGEYEVEE